MCSVSPQLDGSLTGCAGCASPEPELKVKCPVLTPPLQRKQSRFLPSGSKVLQDDEFTKDLFRFLQLLCEGHNNGRWLHRRKTVRKTSKRATGFRINAILFQVPPAIVIWFRLSELPENSDRQHDHSEHHH